MVFFVNNICYTWHDLFICHSFAWSYKALKTQLLLASHWIHYVNILCTSPGGAGQRRFWNVAAQHHWRSIHRGAKPHGLSMSSDALDSFFLPCFSGLESFCFWSYLKISLFNVPPLSCSGFWVRYIGEFGVKSVKWWAFELIRFFFKISHQFYTHQCIHVNPNRPIQQSSLDFIYSLQILSYT